jgi:cell wall-associated NlpC family hydrolase
MSGAMTKAIATWFDTTERRSILMQVCRLWDNTPFFPNSCAPGPDGGVDCVNLLNAVYATCACIPIQKIPRHDMHASQHDAARSPLIAAFETWPDLASRFTRLSSCEASVLLPGDALCFRSGHVPYHSAVMLPYREVLHVLSPHGVRRTRVEAVIRGRSLLGRLEAVYRPHP